MLKRRLYNIINEGEKMSKRIRMILWHLGILKNCPICGSKLIERYGEWDYKYNCSKKECEFNKN
jgi:hypothetical protein